jgi:hypothetical protein
MLPKLSTTTKIILVLLCFGIAIYGFMIKLPSSFRRHDKELHSLFYFLAAAFLNILFVGNRWIRHIVVFAFLYLFGMAIEYSQEYSNKLLKSRIHGRYDVEDVQANLKGLIAFSVVWVLAVIVRYVYSRVNTKNGL